MKNVRHGLAAISLAVCAALGGGAAAWADTPSSDLEAIRERISANMTRVMPALPAITEVRETPISGLYEIRVGEAEIAYTDAQGRYIVQGSLLDIETKRNLTQDRIDALTAIDFDSLPFEQAIVITRGDGSRKLAVFEDPNCSYCHRFEQQLATVDNVTVYVFLYPILSPDSFLKSRNIWCAENPQAAWENWTQRQQAPAEAVCDTKPIDDNVNFGRNYRIEGTPTLIFTDGTKIPGAIDAAKIEERLNAAHGN